MAAQLVHVISFVDDLEGAIAFYRDVLGFKLRFSSPGWVEFETGSTSFALHPATPEVPAGTVKLGVRVESLDAFRATLAQQGLAFTREPEVVHGIRLAEFRGPSGAPVSVSAPI